MEPNWYLASELQEELNIKGFMVNLPMLKWWLFYCKYLLFILWCFSHSKWMIFLYNEVKLIPISFIDCSFSVLLYLQNQNHVFLLRGFSLICNFGKNRLCYRIQISYLLIHMKSHLQSHLYNNLSFLSLVLMPPP